MFDNEGHEALDGNPGLGYNTLLFRLIPDLLIVLTNSSTHYPAFQIFGLHCQTGTLMHTCQAERQPDFL